MALLDPMGEPDARGELAWERELEPELELLVLCARARARRVVGMRLAIALAPLSLLVAVFTAALASALG